MTLSSGFSAFSLQGENSVISVIIVRAQSASVEAGDEVKRLGPLAGTFSGFGLTGKR